MNKAELVAAVAEKTNFTKKDAEVAINAFLPTTETRESRMKLSTSQLPRHRYSRLERL